MNIIIQIIKYFLPSYIIIKHPARDACLCMGDLQAPPAPHFVFLITLLPLGNFFEYAVVTPLYIAMCFLVASTV